MLAVLELLRFSVRNAWGTHLADRREADVISGVSSGHRSAVERKPILDARPRNLTCLPNRFPFWKLSSNSFSGSNEEKSISNGSVF